METGSDNILQLINKGFRADTVVESGCMAKDADMILSEFILRGIGGKELSEENAIQTAKVLNVIQPGFIRVHATGIKPESKMWEFVQEGSFTLQSEEEMLSAVDNFLGLPEDEKLLFIVGRRLNIFFLLDDLKNPQIDFNRLCNYVRQSQI